MIVSINAAAGRYAGRYGQSRTVFEAPRHGRERAWRSERGINICARSVYESYMEPHSNITTGK